MSIPESHLSLPDLIRRLDEELPIVETVELPESELTFFVPGTWETSPPFRSGGRQRPRLVTRVRVTVDDPALIGFILTMLGFGATVAGIVFNARLTQIW